MIGTYLYQAGISIPFTPNAVIIAQAFDESDFFVFAGNSLQGGDCGGNEEG